MADYALVKEKMVELGETLVSLGYDGPQETIEGAGDVGQACRDCREPLKAKLVAEYLKDLHMTFKTRKPDAEGNKDKAALAVIQTWNEVRQALSDDPDVKFEATAPPPPGRGPTPAAPQGRRVAAPVSARPVTAVRAGPTIAAGRGLPSVPMGPPRRR